jgi:FSR family fosmidomycin resistance protein-like MFS transporter
MAAGSRHGLAQSLFQVGGNFGSALGPLAAAIFVVRYGQSMLAGFALLSLLSAAILWNVSVWYKHHGLSRLRASEGGQLGATPLPQKRALDGIIVLLVLVFSKYIYLASLTSYYTFYLIHHFHVSVRSAQLHLFLFLAAVALGVLIGGPVGDRIGRKRVILISTLGPLPFTLLLPYADLFWTSALSVAIAAIMASAFSAIVVYGQEIVPGRVGLISGMFFGFAFGIAGLGAAALGTIADATSIELVYRICAFLPLIGAFALFLPEVEHAPAPA